MLSAVAVLRTAFFWREEVRRLVADLAMLRCLDPGWYADSRGEARVAAS
jgi:hypothetical protein